MTVHYMLRNKKYGVISETNVQWSYCQLSGSFSAYKFMVSLSRVAIREQQYYLIQDCK
jgi:hypothetical protein